MTCNYNGHDDCFKAWPEHYVIPGAFLLLHWSTQLAAHAYEVNSRQECRVSGKT
jgi:hypothetical protein